MKQALCINAGKILPMPWIKILDGYTYNVLGIRQSETGLKYLIYRDPFRGIWVPADAFIIVSETESLFEVKEAA